MEEVLKFLQFPESLKILKDLKFHFNENGELRHLETNEPFVYNYFKDGHTRNHKHYQVLGHIITQFVYELLEKTCNLMKMYLPVDAQANEPLSFFFISDKALTNPSSLIVLLQDRGVIRAGQWCQRTIIHQSLAQGTQIPFIKRAMEEYGGVIVLNPNDNFISLKTEEEPLAEVNEPHSLFEFKKASEIPKRGSSSPEEHTMCVWDYFITKSAARNIAFIAHGYGGLVFVDLLMQRKAEIMEKVFAVAFIDSLHHIQHQAGVDAEVQDWILKHGRGWTSSTLPLDKPTGCFGKVDCPKVSTGTENHELAPFCSLQSVFRFLARSLRAKTNIAMSRPAVQTRSASLKKTIWK